MSWKTLAYWKLRDDWDNDPQLRLQADALITAATDPSHPENTDACNTFREIYDYPIRRVIAARTGLSLDSANCDQLLGEILAFLFTGTQPSIVEDSRDDGAQPMKDFTQLSAPLKAWQMKPVDERYPLNTHVLTRARKYVDERERQRRRRGRKTVYTTPDDIPTESCVSEADVTAEEVLSADLAEQTDKWFAELSLEEQEFLSLRSKGVSVEDAGKRLGMSRATAYRVNSKLYTQLERLLSRGGPR